LPYAVASTSAAAAAAPALRTAGDQSAITAPTLGSAEREAFGRSRRLRVG
jgi:hypothetical protein